MPSSDRRSGLADVSGVKIFISSAPTLILLLSALNWLS